MKRTTVLGLLFLTACRSIVAGAPPAPVADVLLAAVRSTTSFDALVRSGALAADEPLRVEELGRDGDTSHHLVSLREREPLHRHDRHALLVVMLKGHGTMQLELGGEARPVGPGSLLYVPRGTPHAFINRSGEPAVAYVIYSPPYDGNDRQLVD